MPRRDLGVRHVVPDEPAHLARLHPRNARRSIAQIDRHVVPLASCGVTRRYLVRTYGCQMNEHDSERIAGLLEADGLVPAVSEDDADVVVLNTCCIRENADNKFYGNLGHLKAWKGERDEPPDRGVGMPGPEGSRDRP